MALYDVKFTGRLELNESNNNSNNVKVESFNLNEVLTKMLPEVLDSFSKQTKPRQEDN